LVGKQERTQDAPIRLLVATDRSLVQSFLERLAGDAIPPFEFHCIAVSPAALAHGSDDVSAATVAVVDLGLDPSAGVQLCQELRRRRPELPLGVVVCCPDPATAWNLRVLLADGVGSILDLQGTGEETRRALETLARGGSVLQLRLRREQGGVFTSLLTGGPPNSEMQVRLLELVAHGLPDHEIGRRLHLSPHTVKHQTEALRRGIGVRNRIELAAWAGQHGFYLSAGAGETRTARVRLAD